MIFYSPITGDVQTTKIAYRPRTCFLMTQLGGDIPAEAEEIRATLLQVLKVHDVALIDASSEVTGKDFLQKIWQMIVSVPLGMAVIHKEMPARTQCNIFYEIGMAQALGKETMILKAKDAQVPSDFVRTEYISHDQRFAENLHKYLDSFFKQASYYETLADQLEENNPLLAIDYLRRAFLISGDETLRSRVNSIFDSVETGERASNSVEMLLADVQANQMHVKDLC